MATVAQDAKLRERIDRYVDYLISEWEDVPAIACEWDEWSDHERLDFAIDWPIREDRLRQLQHWDERGLLTDEQRTRYEQLLQLVAKYRTLLEPLLGTDRLRNRYAVGAPRWE